MATTLRFRLTGEANPLMLIPVEVNGTGPGEFVLDTGAGTCVLSPEAATRAGVEKLREKQAMGAGGPMTIALGRARSMTVGTERHDDVDVAVTAEVERISAAVKTKLDGVIGFNFLRGYRMTIDYRAQTLRLAKAPNGLEILEVPERPERHEEFAADGAHGSAAGSRVSFKLAGAAKPLVMVHVFADGQGPFAFAVDTGASRTMISPGLAEQLRLHLVAEPEAVTGGGGQFQISTSSIHWLAVGDAMVRDHAVGVGGFIDMLGKVLGTRLDGVLGHNFLSQFLVTLDYPGSTLELLPVSDAGKLVA